MSPLPESPLPRFYARAFFIAAAAGLAVLLWQVLSPFSAPLLWASLLAFMAVPLQQRLLARWKRPNLAAGVVTALVALVIAGPVSVFAVAFFRQASDLYARFQAEAHDRKLPALQLVLEWGPIQRLVALLGEFTSLSKEQLLAHAADAAQAALQQLASLGGSVVLGAFSVVSKFLLTVFLLFFFVRDGQRMLSLAVRLVPMPTQRKERLLAEMGGVTKAVVLGTLVTAAVQGTLLGVGFAIAGLPSPLVFGAVGALASLVPVVGTTLVWAPAALSLLAAGQLGWAAFLLVWSVVLVAGSDNVVRPLIISGRSSASTLLVFIGVLGGVGAFGFAGLFVGPLLLSLVGALLRFIDESRVARTQESLAGLPKVG